AVDRHERETVLLGPPAGQVSGGTFGCADAAADADGDVGAFTEFAVGRDEQIVEVFPRVVAAGAAALDVHDDVALGNLGRDLDDGLDLVDRARLEHHIADADRVELA